MNAVSLESDLELIDVDDSVDVVVDGEFASLIPPLSADELRELEASLVEHGGARDPLIVWDREEEPPILLDGHNRLAICRRVGLPYSVKGIRFRGRDDAAKWMERNQLGRRNLTRSDFTLLLGRLYNRTKRPVGGRPPAGGSPERTRERLASEYAVDPRTVDRAGAFQAAAEKLGVEREIATGRLRVSIPGLVAAAKTLPENPPREAVAAAIRRSRGKPRQEVRAGQSWLVPASPADCLKAIRFYAKSFMMQCPESVDALNAMLRRLIEENTERVE
jgi:hypothetical protein